MPMLDVFRGDTFNTLSLSTAINKLPYKPSRLGDMNLFRKFGITTTAVVVEERHGKLYLIPNKGRGADPSPYSGKNREARSFLTTHLPLSGAVYADDVQNLRAFGSETAMETVSGLVNDKLGEMRQSVEYTHEHMRVGSTKGILLDADGSTVIYNWFTEFGITQDTVTIDWADTNGVKTAAHAILRLIQDALGATPFDTIHCMVGDTLYDALTIAPETKVAYDRWREGAFLRGNQAREMFEYAGIMWENYRGKVGSTPFYDLILGAAFPTGAPGIFEEAYAPADFVETVNTRGLPLYAKQKRMDYDRGIDLFVQSNPLIYCSRPKCLIEVDDTGTRPT